MSSTDQIATNETPASNGSRNLFPHMDYNRTCDTKLSDIEEKQLDSINLKL